MSVHFSSAKDDWCTPAMVLERVLEVRPIGLDPCWNPRALTMRDRYCAMVAEYDGGGTGTSGLDRDWSGHGLVYVNPPYGRQIGEWVEKCPEADECIALLPARTDTRWFPWEARALAFWRGRLTFLGAEHPAPFPSVLAYWGDLPGRFAAAFEDVCRVVRP